MNFGELAMPACFLWLTFWRSFSRWERWTRSLLLKFPLLSVVWSQSSIRKAFRKCCHKFSWFVWRAKETAIRYGEGKSWVSDIASFIKQPAMLINYNILIKTLEKKQGTVHLWINLFKSLNSFEDSCAYTQVEHRAIGPIIPPLLSYFIFSKEI